MNKNKPTRRNPKPERLSEHAPITLRLPTDLVSRLDALVEAVATDSNLATMLGGVTRSGVLRLAVLEGVQTLEARYQPRRSRR